MRHSQVDVEKEHMQWRILSLEAQQVADREQLLAKDAQLAAKDEQLRVKDEQLRVRDEHITSLEQLVSEDVTETKRQLRQVKKRKDKYGEATAGRKHRTEPERRAVARRQNYRCANPYGKCLLPGELEAFDVDHVLPVWKGGSEESENLQALCPACHRMKTNIERKERKEYLAARLCVVE